MCKCIYKYTHYSYIPIYVHMYNIFIDFYNSREHCDRRMKVDRANKKKDNIIYRNILNRIKTYRAFRYTSFFFLLARKPFACYEKR